MQYSRQLLLAKVESVVGTDAVPTAPLNALLVRDFTWVPDIQKRERPVSKADLSATPSRPGRRTATMTFVAEIKGSGEAGTAPKLGTLLRGCGMAETELASDAGFHYDPISTAFESLTLYCYIDGLLYKLFGGRGSWSVNAGAGDDALMSFTFQGSYVKPIDAVFPTTQVFEDTLPNLVELSELAVLGNTSCAQQYTIDYANAINPRLCVNAAFGVSGYNIGTRAVTGSFNPEAQLIAAFDPFTILQNGTVGDFHAVVGTEDDNIVEFDGNVQYNNVTPGNRDNTLIHDIPVTFVGELGNDEIRVTFPQSGP